MGQFADTLFRVLLGWVQTAASWLWSLVTNTDVSAWLAWLLDNWLPLVLLLCVGGLALDFIVYLLRWQPYRVWRSFFRRVTARDEIEEEAAPKPLFQRKLVYADGSTAVEDVHQPVQEAMAPPEDQLDAPIRPVRRVVRTATREQAYHQPVYPPQWQHNAQDHQGENE